MKIVDEFTGRILEGRRWSEGLHQAVEAKERREDQGGEPDPRDGHPAELLPHVRQARGHDRHRVTPRPVSSRTPTTSRSCRSPPTGRWSASTSPTSSTRARTAKFDAAADDIAERHETGQPVLVGTISVEKSEQLSRLLEKRGIPHAVLNAKQHEREAHIVTQAGRLGAVTVATNMAGRGVDILLGGNPEGLAQPGAARRAAPRSRSRPRTYAGAASTAVPGRVRGRRRPGARARRALRARHRAPREPPHRQPAAWPLRPPGRPGREPLLPLARRRAHAPVRHRRHELGDGQGVPRRHAARGEDGHQGDRARAAHRRRPQLRDPQGRPQVRRGDERAAQGDLPAPPADPRRRRPPRRGARGDRERGQPRSSTTYCPGEFPEEWDLDELHDADPRTYFPTRDHTRAARRGRAPRRCSSSCSSTTRVELYETKEAVDRRRHAARRSSAA